MRRPTVRLTVLCRSDTSVYRPRGAGQRPAHRRSGQRQRPADRRDRRGLGPRPQHRARLCARPDGPRLTAQTSATRRRRLKRSCPAAGSALATLAASTARASSTSSLGRRRYVQDADGLADARRSSSSRARTCPAARSRTRSTRTPECTTAWRSRCRMLRWANASGACRLARRTDLAVPSSC